MKLSARNQLKGKVVSIQEGAVNAIVGIDIGGGNVISATISMAAVKELGLGKQLDCRHHGRHQQVWQSDCRRRRPHLVSLFPEVHERRIGEV